MDKQMFAHTDKAYAPASISNLGLGLGAAAKTDDLS